MTSDNVTDCDLEERVAVIGIHGVGEHDPGEVCRAITEQLLSHGDHAYCATAQEGRIRLNVEASSLFPKDARPAVEPSQKGFARLKRGFGSAFLKRQSGISANAPIDQRFTAALLAGGENYTATHTAHVQPMLRRDKDGRCIRVDVHEMFWSDLSHSSSTSGFKIFDQFAQLMLHVASLGRSTLATVLAERDFEQRKYSTLWHITYGLSASGYWLLSMPILQGNLLLLMLACLMLPALLPAATLAPAFGVFAGLIVALACGSTGIKYCGQKPGGLNRVVPWSLAAGIIAGGVTWHFARGWGDIRHVLTGLEGAALLLAGHLAMGRYGKSRPGSLGVWWALVSMVVIIGIAAACLKSPGDMAPLLPVKTFCSTAVCQPVTCAFGTCMEDTCVQISCFASGKPPASGATTLLLNWLAHTTEGLFHVLVVTWLVLFAVNAALVACACVLWLTGRNSEEDKRLRAVGTALIAAAVPPPLLLSAILLAWTIWDSAFQSILPDQGFTPWIAEWIASEKISWLNPTLFKDVIDLKGFLQGMIAFSATNALLPYLACMLVAMLLLAWAVLPSVAVEIRPPKFTSSKSAAKGKCATALGNWLDGGIRAMAWAAMASWIGFFVLLPIADYAQVFNLPAPNCLRSFLNWLLPHLPDTDHVVLTITTWFGAGAGTLLAATKLFGKNFSNFFGRLRVVVDTAMDVDNWLRERPRGDTPRLRIFARYMALLNFIKAGNYDKIIIVAHSQGTVVTADFFRYLQHQLPQELHPP